ncbi:MAG TPA: glycosyltransferase family 2 protein [bacterium]|nr:glycosyltransferase family 2 protein [Candidatus Pacearchaeota archaeon]HPO11358.1 glycosyltransferase family 2 protein [bacterium]
MISVIILNYNGKKWLEKCLDSLFNQTYKEFEIIFVDNNSSDDSVEFVNNRYGDRSNLKVIKSDKNLGFAGGNNLGIKYASGEYVLLLNNDTWVKENYLEEMMEGFLYKGNIGCIQSKILIMDRPDILDVVGSYWTFCTALYYFGASKKDCEKYNEPIPFFANKGASMMLKREIIDKIGYLFDNDFWCYYEDTDLCNMLWMLGYECWYWPYAVCYHANGGTSSMFKNNYIQFHNFKNKLMSFIKNFDLTTLLYVVPIYLLFCVFVSFVWLFMGKFSNFIAIYKAIFWNIKNIKKTLIKRKNTQSKRTVSDKDIFKLVRKNPRLSYYFYLLFNKIESYKD